MTAPVDELIDRPVGRLVALQVSVAPVWVSDPTGVKGEMAEPETLALAEMAVTATVLVMVQAKLVTAVCPPKSVTLTTTEETPGVVGVPVMAPVEALMASPAGRPEADQVSTALGWVSLAEGYSVEMAEPVTLVWLPGLVTMIVSETVQAKVAEPANGVGEPLSVAVTVTEHEHDAVGVPEMAPVDELIVSPVGRPLAE